MAAYAFTKKELPCRNIFLTLGTITLFFYPGLIPTYLWYRDIKILDSFWVLILPMAFSFYDALIFMGFFRNIPESIEESAYIDGANELQIFIRLIIPLSTPVFATIAIFNGVAQWNDYFSGFIYIRRNDFLVPIQTFLYQMVSTNEAYSKIPELSRPANQVKVTPDSIRVATMLITTAPVMVVYPFLQKYFTKGVMLGAVKGLNFLGDDE
jgi:putative aldouronate transport system permease protein